MPLLPPIAPASARLIMAIRLLQLLLALAYFVLLIYSFQNKGWWLNLSTPVTIGCQHQFPLLLPPPSVISCLKTDLLVIA